jgi:hypothetical protein
VHQPRGHQRALLARVDADRLAVFEEQERGQRAARLDASGGDQLRLEDVDGGKSRSSASRFVDVGQRGVGGAEVDADFHAVGERSREQDVEERTKGKNNAAHCGSRVSG